MSEKFEKYEELIQHLEHIQKMRYQAIKWAFAAQKEISEKSFKDSRDVAQADRLTDLTESIYQPIPYQVWENMRDNYDQMAAETFNGVETK